MAINYRVGSIIIAAVTIIGAIFDSVQLFFISTNTKRTVYIYIDNIKLHQALTIISNITSLMCSSCLYFVISIDIKTNVKRRKFLLPYISWGSILCVWKLTSFGILVVRYGSEIDNIQYAMSLLGPLVLFIFVCIEASYYRLLGHDNGSKLNSKSMLLRETPYIRRKSRPSATGRIYYDDEEEIGLKNKSQKGRKNENNNFVSTRLKDMNENVFMLS